MEEAVAKDEAGQVQVNPHLPPEAKAAAITMIFTQSIQARGASLDILSNLNFINRFYIHHQ